MFNFELFQFFLNNNLSLLVNFSIEINYIVLIY
jgi:hypothetical protein